ncbi:peptidoglycan-N-acetylglucosamine deacetylase [Moorella thermoacetica]|uniref:Peptidoglycan-N-acetylglucosamine deacetylase n=1 Tax=Neomoorella thermoacetica TaxID=1525 RepID=A0A1J5NK50_NEOTH|nr:peptidoglycan-N-acetylglucosamine deacetylase [Moorella thermoacetica]
MRLTFSGDSRKGWSPRRSGPSLPQVALTFDDGPDPRYTPVILATLARWQVRATFFMVGEQAQAYPDLVRRVYEEGHDIGNHTLSHRHGWLTLPARTVQEWEKAQDILAGITSTVPRFFRPPWGKATPTTRLWVRERGLLVLYSVIPGDWRYGTSPGTLAERVLKAPCLGDIILLHDHGRLHPEAPAATVTALEIILAGLEQRGVKAVPLREWWPLYRRK